MELILLVAVLLGCWLLWSLMPMRWRRWLMRSRQDAVNEKTVETLEAVSAAIGSLEDRMTAVEHQVARQAEVFSGINRFLKSGESSSPTTTGPSTSSLPSSPVPPPAAPPGSRTAAQLFATETTSD
jgi:hypothetical protein